MSRLREDHPERFGLVLALRLGAGAGAPMTRTDLVEAAVVEAARRYVAAQLRAERKACGVREDAQYYAYQDAVNVSLDALQELRDACAAHSCTRDRP